jgi:hypothetical protein
MAVRLAIIPTSLAAILLGCSGAGDSSTSAADLSAEPILMCRLQYEAFDPLVLATLSTGFGVLSRGGITAWNPSVTTWDPGYSFSVQPTAPANLTITATITGPDRTVAYAVLPRSVLASQDEYLFEVGGRVPPVHRSSTDGGPGQTFDYIRGYCIIDGTSSSDAGVPSFDGGPPHFDAGPPPHLDGGPPHVDAGPPSFDGGSWPPDLDGGPLGSAGNPGLPGSRRFS